MYTNIYTANKEERKMALNYWRETWEAFVMFADENEQRLGNVYAIQRLGRLITDVAYKEQLAEIGHFGNPGELPSHHYAAACKAVMAEFPRFWNRFDECLIFGLNG